MNIQISTRHMTVSEVIKQMVRELCGEVHHKYGGIQNIDIKIEDMNGPHKAGIDKRCHLKVRGKEHLAIDIDEIDEDLDCAIDNAFHRLKQVLRRCHLYHAYKHVNVFDMNNFDFIAARGI